MPIEHFKQFSDESFVGTKPYKTFYSSGTSNHRSTSPYSKKGLELYRKSSIEHIEKVFEKLCFDPRDAVLISWVPTSKEWPDSSLAQMLEWFALKWPSVYLRPGEALPKIDKPIWLFSTAVDLYEACNKQMFFDLHPASLIFETGGTKTQSNTFNKNLLYSKIREKFGLPNNRIVSEYGMSELACQAYDFFNPRSGGRIYSFEKSVQIKIESNNGKLKNQGVGCLAVKDPNRIDYPSYIRTQDIVELQADGSFQLIGRVPNNILKGCSLLSEKNHLEKREGSQRISEEQTNSLKTTNEEEVLKKSQHLTEGLNKIFNSRQYRSALESELNSINATEHEITNLIEGLPKKPEEWLLSCKRSVGGMDYAKGWLYILPSNHSLVGLYPIVMGYLLDLDLTIRIPKAFSAKSSVLQTWLKLFSKKFDLKYKTVGTSFNLLKEQLDQYDCVLAYGSDQTLEQFKKINKPIKYFAHHDHIQFCQDIFEEAEKIIEDAFSLGQKGCLDTKAIVVDKKIEEKDISKLQQKFKNFFGEKLSLYQKIALQHESSRYESMGFSVGINGNLGDFSTALFPTIETKESDLSGFLSKCPFVLPIIIRNNAGENNKLAQQAPSTKWDGTHLEEPLFV